MASSKVGGNQDHPAIGQRLSGNLLPRQSGELPLQFGRNLGGQGLIGGDQHGQGLGIVFGLGQHVGGNSGAWRSSSATISTSVGPAIMSMRTRPETWRLASVTYWLPGPTMTSHRGMVSVP